MEYLSYFSENIAPFTGRPESIVHFTHHVSHVRFRSDRQSHRLARYDYSSEYRNSPNTAIPRTGEPCVRPEYRNPPRMPQSVRIPQSAPNTAIRPNKPSALAKLLLLIVLPFFIKSVLIVEQAVPQLEKGNSLLTNCCTNGDSNPLRAIAVKATHKKFLSVSQVVNDELLSYCIKRLSILENELKICINLVVDLVCCFLWLRYCIRR